MTGEPDRESLAEGTLISHLIELRQRLLKAVVAVFLCFIPCAIFSDKLFTLVALPLIEKMPAGWDLSGSIRRPKEHVVAVSWVKFESTIAVRTTTLDAWCAEHHG